MKKRLPTILIYLSEVHSSIFVPSNGAWYTRGLATVPVLFVTALYVDNGTADLLVLSQVVLSMQLPLVVVPLVRFVTDEGQMREFVVSRPVAIASWAAEWAIVILNLKMLYDTFVA